MANIEVFIDVHIRPAPDEPTNWQRISHIPLDKLPTRLVESIPLSKWLRCSLFAITGAKDTLSTNREQPEPSWHHDAATFPLEPHVLFYHYNPDDRGSFVDHDHELLLYLATRVTLMRYKTKSGTEVSKRDGDDCILTPLRCAHATHLVPRHKGDEYIKRLIE